MPLWSLFLLQAVLPPNPPAVTAPPPCPTPPQYTYSDWEQTREERQYQGEWVVQYLHYSRMKSDECRGTSSTQRKVEGPYRLWPAVPANRVADVNRPEGPTDGLSGAPLRSSTITGTGAPGMAGPNPDLPKSKTSEVPANRLPVPLPFFPGFALFAGVLVASFFLRRRESKVAPVPEHESEPVVGPLVEPATARTMDSIKPNTEWTPDSAEVAWLQAFFGIEETGYGPLTKGAVKGFQEKNKIPPDPKVMIGPNTYRALWTEHINLVHEHWQKRAVGERSPALERVMDSPLPPDLRAEVEKLNETYSAYFAAAEGRYQAILRRDPNLIAEYDDQIEASKSSGVKVDDIAVLKEKYQPAIDALYHQAEKVKQKANDGDYAKLLAMLDAADDGRWDEIAGVRATLGGRWDSLWRSDRKERNHAQTVTDVLDGYRGDLGLVNVTSSGTLAGAGQGASEKDTSEATTNAHASIDTFWTAIGPAPVMTKGGRLEFADHFASWASDYNSMVAKHWAGKTTDHAGTPKDRLISTYQMTPVKVEQLWDAAERNNVDPRLLLAILVQEGTGSFDTNPENAGKYLNGNGPQPDWTKDLNAAFDSLILAKLRLYPAAVKGGFSGDWVDYVNWYTPIDRINHRTGKVGESGVYAEDIFWGNRVRQIYEDIVRELSPGSEDPVGAFSDWMAAHSELFKPKYVSGAFEIRPGNTSGIEAAVHAARYDPRQHPNAYHRKDKDGNEVKSWYFFPAPQWYVWSLVPGSSGGGSALPQGTGVQYRVPVLKQVAADWKETGMAPAETDASKATTIGNYGCAVTAAAMALQYLGVQTDPNDIVNRAIRNDEAAARDERENTDLSLSSVWELNWYQLAKEYQGIKVSDASYVDLKQIREWLAKGPVILGATGENGPHFVVVTGYTGEGIALSDFTINDPGEDRRTLSDFHGAYNKFRWVRQFTK